MYQSSPAHVEFQEGIDELACMWSRGGGHGKENCLTDSIAHGWSEAYLVSYGELPATLILSSKDQSAKGAAYLFAWIYKSLDPPVDAPFRTPQCMVLETFAHPSLARFIANFLQFAQFPFFSLLPYNLQAVNSHLFAIPITVCHKKYE